MEALILAGGKGTRLRPLTLDLPKPMVPVAGRPFLEHLLTSLADAGVERSVLSVGYKAECIVQHFGSAFCGIALDYEVEDEPLGTGGAILAALPRLNGSQVLILNGDTFFQVSLMALMDFHLAHDAELSLALKPLEDFDRYGNVVLDGDRIVAFEDRRHCARGHINGGIYCMNRGLLQRFELGPRFSFETDFMQPQVAGIAAYGHVSEGYFIDIGVPQDYRRAQQELPAVMAGCRAARPDPAPAAAPAPRAPPPARRRP